ncbi:MAG: aspartate-semialdehyde dehydrogenase [Burkholderiaceae bacterium]
MKPSVGIVGWRGMVGSVLLQRMQAEQDFAHISARFFSTSNVGGQAPLGAGVLADAFDIDALAACDVILTCQGGDYTQEVHPRLRAAGWQGYWIDAASSLRMNADAVIVLDPLNRSVIDHGLETGIRDYIGGNCTVSLMMLGLAGLLEAGLVRWITAMTYQAASGGGAQQMRELITQMGAAHAATADLLADPASDIMEIDATMSATLRSDALPTEHTVVPLAGSLIPWIDRDLGNGMSREEWKGHAECNKILGRAADAQIPIESLCVRIGAMRCHSQALTVQLTEDLPLERIETLIAQGNEWVHLVPNQREASMRELSPVTVNGSLQIAVGRVRKLAIAPGMISVFTVGDQLLWGAAEPLRRMLRILVERG